MYKRLKRLEKFESQAREKAKATKPKLLNSASSSFANGQGGSAAQNGLDENSMELAELAKHLGIKVSTNWKFLTSF